MDGCVGMRFVGCSGRGCGSWCAAPGAAAPAAAAAAVGCTEAAPAAAAPAAAAAAGGCTETAPAAAAPAAAAAARGCTEAPHQEQQPQRPQRMPERVMQLKPKAHQEPQPRPLQPPKRVPTQPSTQRRLRDGRRACHRRAGAASLGERHMCLLRVQASWNAPGRCRILRNNWRIRHRPGKLQEACNRRRHMCHSPTHRPRRNCSSGSVGDVVVVVAQWHVEEGHVAR